MKINPPIAEVSTPLFEREGLGVSLMKKIYSTPELQIVHVEVQSPLLNISIYEKEISDNYGLTKEENEDLDDLWDD